MAWWLVEANKTRPWAAFLTAVHAYCHPDTDWQAYEMLTRAARTRADDADMVAFRAGLRALLDLPALPTGLADDLDEAGCPDERSPIAFLRRLWHDCYLDSSDHVCPAPEHRSPSHSPQCRCACGISWPGDGATPPPVVSQIWARNPTNPMNRLVEDLSGWDPQTPLRYRPAGTDVAFGWDGGDIVYILPVDPGPAQDTPIGGFTTDVRLPTHAPANTNLVLIFAQCHQWLLQNETHIIDRDAFTDALGLPSRQLLDSPPIAAAAARIRQQTSTQTPPPDTPAEHDRAPAPTPAPADPAPDEQHGATSRGPS